MKALLLLINSLKLDVAFTRHCSWTINQKIFFIVQKYYLIIKSRLTKFSLGKSHTLLLGKKYFYNSPIYGLASLQSEWTIHYPLLKNIPHPATVIDIGASVGNFSLLIHMLYPSSIQFAIEPVKASYSALQANCSSFAKCFNIAIADRTGYIIFKIDEQYPEQSEINQIGSKISAQTLDEFVIKNDIENITLIKIDVEKHELEVLLGATKSLAMTQYLLIEVTSYNNSNYTTAQLFSQLQGSGYNFTTINVYPYYANNQIYMIDYLLKNIEL